MGNPSGRNHLTKDTRHTTLLIWKEKDYRSNDDSTINKRNLRHLRNYCLYYDWKENFPNLGEPIKV